MTFSLSTHNFPTKIFLANRSELEGRIDPEMVLYNRKTKSFKFNSIALKNVLKKAPQYGANESGIERKSSSEARYIRITDIDEYGLLKDSIGVTAETIEKKYILNNNDILLARSGATVGKAYLHNKDNVNYDCFFAGYMIRILVDETLILPSYFFTYTQLSPYQDWVKSIQRAAGQPNINAEEYKSLLIPLPPIDLQQKIVDLIEASYAVRKQKENQSQELLASIDDFLLSEMGISPIKQDNSLADRIFTINFKAISGGRFDAPIHRSTFTLMSNKYEMKKLMDAFDFNPSTNIEVDECSFIPMESVSEIEGDILDMRTINPSESNGYTKFQENDLLWARITPCMQNGKSAIALNLKNRVGLGSTEFFVFRSKNNNNIHFLHSILRLKYLRDSATLFFGGAAGHQRVSTDFFKKMYIPLPANKKQSEIVEHIQYIKNQAKTLRLEANNVLETAKQEVEKMIIG